MRIAAQFAKGAAVCFVAALAVLPLALLGGYSFTHSWFWPEIIPKQWDLHAWRYVFSEESGVATSLAVSFGIGLIVSVVAVLVSIPAARVFAWYEFPGKRAALYLLLLPVLAPPLAAAMASCNLPSYRTR